MIASTCSRVRPVRRAIGFATDLATRPRTPVRDALPISTALFCAVTVEGFPRTRRFETGGVPYRWPVDIRIESVVVDCADCERLANFWSEALGWRITFQSDEEYVIESPEMADEDNRFGHRPTSRVGV